MHTEVSVAVNFVITFLFGKLPRRRVHMLGEELEGAVRAKFIGHWYPEQPLKGTAFRSLKVSGDHPDPLVFEAAREIGLEAAEIFQHLPDNLTLWIDPGEVSYRMGEKGAVTVLYSDKGQHQPEFDSPTLSNSEFNPEAQDFIPIAEQLTMSQNFAQLSLISSQLQQQQSLQLSAELNSYLMQKSSSAPNFFTAAAFAQTKFGSTKLRQHTRRPNRLHPGGGGGGGGVGGGGSSTGVVGGFGDSGGRRARHPAVAPTSQLPPHLATQMSQPAAKSSFASTAATYSSFNRSFSLSPSVSGGMDWSTGLNGQGASGNENGNGGGGNLLSVRIPGGLDYHRSHHSNGSSRQASPGGLSSVALRQQSEQLLLAK